MNRRRLLSLMVVFLFLAGCKTTEVQEHDAQRSNAMFKLGVAYLQENKVQKAFIEFQKAYEANPNDKEVLNAIGIIYLLHYDEPAKAISYFERATRIDVDYSEAYNNLGVAYEKSGQYEAAISSYQRAVSNVLYTTPERAFINMGTCYYRLGRYDLAIGALREALKRAPEAGIAHMRIALCYNALGKYGEAAASLSRAIQIDPVYKGSREKAMEDFTLRATRATGPEAVDLANYIEILKY